MLSACLALAFLLSPAADAASAAPAASTPIINASVDPAERQAIERVIDTYNAGLTSGDLAKFRSALDDRLVMFNGAFSADPTRWEAHMYVAPERLDQWITNYVEGAGPHINRYELLSMHVRANAAVATTEDTGSNRFRRWDKERVTWVLGKRNGEWKIVGYFIRDIRNP